MFTFLFLLLFFFLFFSFFPPDNPSVRFEKNLIFQFVGLRQIVTCHVMGTPKPTVTWLRNGIKLGDGDLNRTVRIRNNVVSGAFGDQIHELLLDTAQLEHSGNYTCEARNKYHARQRNIVVTVICKSNYIVSYIFFCQLLSPGMLFICLNCPRQQHINNPVCFWQREKFISTS